MNKLVNKPKATIQFRDPLGHVFLEIDTQLIKGGTMPATKTTKKVVAKKTTKTATKTKPETEMQCGGVVVESGAEYKNPMILETLYVKQKMSAGEIARQYGVSRAVILHHMKRNNIKITTRKTTKPGAKSDYKKPTWLRKALEAGQSVYAIAKDQGVSYGTVRMQALKLSPVVNGNKATPKKATAKKATTTKK